MAYQSCGKKELIRGIRITREILAEKMKDLPNPPCRVNLIQQVWEIMNGETEELEKENAELKTQIEKMKNCFNCAKGDWNNRYYCLKNLCINKNKWELRK